MQWQLPLGFYYVRHLFTPAAGQPYRRKLRAYQMRNQIMASCDPFSVDFHGSAQDLFNKISTLIHQHGGSVSGGPSGGTFSVPVPVFGTVAGTFSVSGQRCTIHITQRSFFLACGIIENFVRSNIPTVEATAITAFWTKVVACRGHFCLLL